MFNIKDKFYQDICTPYTTQSETDIILSDRIDYIYYNNDTKCQTNCIYSEYFLSPEYINCTCDVDVKVNNEHQITKFNTKKIYESFYDILKYSNYQILKCYNLIFMKNSFTKNIGSIIILVYFLIYIGSFLAFIISGINPLKLNLFKNLKNKNNIRTNKTNNLEINFVFKNNVIINTKGKNYNNNKNKKQFNKNEFNPPKKIHFNMNSNIISKIKNNNKQKRNILINTTTNKKKQKQKINSQIESVSKTNLDGFSKNKLKENIITQNKELIKNNNIKLYNKENNLLNNENSKLDAFELNELDYLEAVKYDKRTFIQIYLDTLKREHIIIFTFFVCNDYNLFLIKLIRFLFLTASDMALNVFFFSDESMHKLYLNYGKYDFYQQMTQIIYSTVLSQLIEVFLCFLSLTDKYIYQIKKLSA